MAIAIKKGLAVVAAEEVDDIVTSTGEGFDDVLRLVMVLVPTEVVDDAVNALGDAGCRVIGNTALNLDNPQPNEKAQAALTAGRTEGKDLGSFKVAHIARDVNNPVVLNADVNGHNVNVMLDFSANAGFRTVDVARATARALAAASKQAATKKGK